MPKDCSRGGEVAVMDISPSPDIDNSRSAKRRKVGNGELRLYSSNSGCDSDDVNQSADVESFSSGDLPASCCSSNGSVTEKINYADLEAETGTTIRRESSPTSKLKEESSKTMLPEKMPTASEIEEFFANAEKDLQKRFNDKYNYDIVKDVPLKGRFEWEKLKP